MRPQSRCCWNCSDCCRGLGTAVLWLSGGSGQSQHFRSWDKDVVRLVIALGPTFEAPCLCGERPLDAISSFAAYASLQASVCPRCLWSRLFRCDDENSMRDNKEIKSCSVRYPRRGQACAASVPFWCLPVCIFVHAARPDQPKNDARSWIKLDHYLVIESTPP